MPWTKERVSHHWLNETRCFHLMPPEKVHNLMSQPWTMSTWLCGQRLFDLRTGAIGLTSHLERALLSKACADKEFYQLPPWVASPHVLSSVQRRSFQHRRHSA